MSGQQDYLLFPQRQGPLLADLRHNTRDLFNRCFEGKDFVGALQALRCLTEVDAVFYDDVAKLLEIVSILPSEDAALQSMASHFSTIIPRKLDSEIKSNLVQTLAHMLVAQRDFSGAKTFIKSNRSRTIAGHFAKLLALDSIIVLLQLLSLSSETVAVMQLPPFPLSSEELFSEPAWVFFSIRLLQHFASGGSSSLFEDGSDLRPRSKAILNEIMVSLASSAFRAEAYNWPTFQFLYLSILAGQGNGEKAHEQIVTIQQKLSAQEQDEMGEEDEGVGEQEQQAIKANYCDIMIRFCILFGERDENHIRDLAQLCYRILRVSDGCHLLQEKQCYLSLFSMMHNLIVRAECLQKFATAIESLSYGNLSKDNHVRIKEKMMWRILAALIGPLQSVLTYEEAISSSNVVQMFVPEMVVANELFANGSERLRNNPINNTNVAEDGEDEDNHFHHHFCRGREWWMDTMLSPIQLDDLSDALIEADIEHLLTLLEDQDISEMTSLPPLQLYSQSPNSFLNRWRTCEEQFAEAGIHLDVSVASMPIISKDIFDDVFAPSLTPNSAETLADLDIDTVNELLAFCVDDNTFADPILQLSVADLSEDDADLDQHFSIGKETIDIPVWFLSNKQGYTRSNIWSGRVHCQETVIVLGKGRLETLTYQALIAAHLQDQDCLFTIRVVQVLCRHALMEHQTARICLSFLHYNGVNIRRAVAKGVEFACRDIPVDEAPPQYFKAPPDQVYLSGNLHAHYQPVPFHST